MTEPVICWTPEEVWVMAGLTRRLLVANIAGVAHAACENGPFRIDERPSPDGVELVLSIDADAALVALAARDVARHCWRDGWLLELARDEERWALEPGTSIEIADARRSPVVARLRVRRRCVIADDPVDNVPLVDAGFHRYTLQSSAIDVTGAGRPAVIPWMTPTRVERAPWWQIDLGKPMCIVWMRIDLAPLPAGTRITCHAFGHPAPDGRPPAGSVVAELAAEDLHAVDDQAWFTVDAPVVARYVRIELPAREGATVALAIDATEIQAADLVAPTLAQTMRRAFALHGERTLCLARSADGDGYTPAYTYAEIGSRAMALSRGLAARLEPFDTRVVVAVVLRNCVEWIVADLAILERGYISVSLSPDDPDDRLAQIFAVAKPRCIVVDARDAERITRLVPDALVLVVGSSFEACVADTAPPPAPHSEDDVYAVLFTSGSTGTPKGAMRTYRTFLAMIASYAIGHSPRHLSFQPVSHLSERMYLPAVLVNGGTIAFSCGGAYLLDEIAALQPTVVGSVPRLYEVLHAGYARRLRAARAEQPDVPWEELERPILADTRRQFGDRLLAVSVGSAPCSDEVLAFLRRCFADVWVSEGYGTTELGTISSNNHIAEHVEVKLVPEPRGEIWVRTPHQITGYLGEPSLTVDDDGFVATGDLGEREDDGRRVRIVGRIRNTIKLAQGEFVAIDRIESILVTAPLVDQIFVHAGYGAAHLSAVVVPKSSTTAEQLAADLREHALAHGLAAYEVPVEIVVETTAFSVENGLLTTSGKLARPALVARYADRLGTASRATASVLPSAASLASRLARIASQVAERTIAVDEPLGAGIGIDSLAAAEALAAMSDDLDREVPLAWWFESRTLADLAARLSASPLDVAVAHRELALADLARPSPAIASTARSVRRVLLTGATGFLGSFLVEALRARGIAATCLVRAGDAASARARLHDVLGRREIDATGVDVIAGDLAQLDDAFDADVDAVVHAGATVSWLASYDALRGPNVLGTLALLAFAARRGVPFHHVSTISTAPPEGDEGSRLDFENVVHSTPYALSKWVAEEHARRAGAAIYRPAMIAPDTRHGIGNAEDFLNRYMHGCAELGMYIDRDDAVIDMTPVDFVAAAIAACVVSGRAGVMHLANVEQSMSYGELGRAMAAAGVETAPATYEAFRAAVIANRACRLHPLAAFFPEQFSLAMGPWPCAKSVAACEALGVARPRIDAALIARYAARAGMV